MNERNERSPNPQNSKIDVYLLRFTSFNGSEVEALISLRTILVRTLSTPGI